MNLDLEISGLSTMLAELEELKQDFEGTPVTIVFSRQEYSAPLEFGRGPITPDGDKPLTFKVDREWVSTYFVEGHPPYPFMRPAINEFKANPEAMIEENTNFVMDEIDTLEDLVIAASSSLETQMKKNVTAQRGAGRSPGTHPEHPLVQTGELRRGIGFVPLNFTE